MTALEAAMDGFRKLSSMGEEMFGQQVFCSGKKNSESKRDDYGEATTACTRKGMHLLITRNVLCRHVILSMLLWTL